MHEWDGETMALGRALVDEAFASLATARNPLWGRGFAEAARAGLRGTITPGGSGGDEALRLFRELVRPACSPVDDPHNVAFVPTAPTPAAALFDIVVSASSIFAGTWEAGAGAILAENEALRWLADLAGFPPGAGGCFVSGGSAANLSALVTARHTARAAGRGATHVVVSSDAHSSVYAAARVMDTELVVVAADERGRMTAEAAAGALAVDGVYAVVGSGGSTNAGAVDDLGGLGARCREQGVWLHVDAAYGGGALCAPSARGELAGIELADSFGIDPHKWLFTPYDCAALVYRDPRLAPPAHSQHAAYLDAMDRTEWNPFEYAFHLSRRARGLPLWFSLVVHGTDAYRDAVERSLTVTRAFVDAIRERPVLELLMEPQLSVVLFRRRGWSGAQYDAWSHERMVEGRARVVPTSWRGEPCLRACILHPHTSVDYLVEVLDDVCQ